MLLNLVIFYPVTLEFGILFLKKTLTLQVTLQQLVLELCYKYITQDFENVKNFVNNFSTVTAIAFILHMSIFLWQGLSTGIKIFYLCQKEEPKELLTFNLCQL